MVQIHKLVLSSVIFVIVLLTSANQTNADTVTLTLTDPVQTGTIGTTLSFTGILTNTGTESVLIDTSGLVLDPFTTSQNLIFSAGALTLAPGQSTGEILLFTVTIDPAIAAPSTIIGFFSVGRSSTVDGQLAIQEFSINVEAIPEPMTLLLLGTGLVGVAVRAVRMKRQS
jgi:hypothetical protein